MCTTHTDAPCPRSHTGRHAFSKTYVPGQPGTQAFVWTCNYCAGQVGGCEAWCAPRLLNALNHASNMYAGPYAPGVYAGNMYAANSYPNMGNYPAMGYPQANHPAIAYPQASSYPAIACPQASNYPAIAYTPYRRWR